MALGPFTVYFKLDLRECYRSIYSCQSDLNLGTVEHARKLHPAKFVTLISYPCHATTYDITRPLRFSYLRMKMISIQSVGDCPCRQILSSGRRDSVSDHRTYSRVSVHLTDMSRTYFDLFRTSRTVLWSKEDRKYSACEVMFAKSILSLSEEEWLQVIFRCVVVECQT